MLGPQNVRQMVGVHCDATIGIRGTAGKRRLLLGGQRAALGARCDGDVLQPERGPTADLRQLSLQGADAAFRSPTGDERADRLPRQNQLWRFLGFGCILGGIPASLPIHALHKHLVVAAIRALGRALLQSVEAPLLWQQMGISDGDLLLNGVARQLDYLHAVQQRPIDQTRIIRRANKQRVADIERRVHIVVSERRVLLGVQNLQHSRLRVEHLVPGHLVDLVQQNDGVPRARLEKGLDDGATHAADVSAPVPADFGFVAHAAEGQPLEAPAQGARHGSAQGRLADPRRAMEAQDRALGVPAHLPDGKKF
mmetsp:Transcript_61570/g.178590  ORF Transcript_61570/g.178590 Transcript_61570/m.178590 type:complete len:310 (-) Transcript_61570:1226-2155(-)